MAALFDYHFFGFNKKRNTFEIKYETHLNEISINGRLVDFIKPNDDSAITDNSYLIHNKSTKVSVVDDAKTVSQFQIHLW